MLSPHDLAALRFGMGLPLPKGAPADPDGMLALLAGPDLAAAARPLPSTRDALTLVVAALEARRANRQSGMSDGADPMLAETREQVRAFVLNATRTQMARALDSPDGLRERLVRFWADHFTVRARIVADAPLPAAMTEDAIRPNLTGRFADLLVAVTLHPAMLAYLDQTTSIGPNSPIGKRRRRGLNENLARELIELHTLGVGAAYTQTDVRELAELLTGLAVDGENGTVFRLDWAEPGAETVLGKAYDGEGIASVVALLHDLALRPETAAHLARKIAVHMVSDTPDPGLVTALTGSWIETGGDLMAVYATMLHHPAAWGGRLEKMRQPHDLVLAGLRALEVTGEMVMAMPERAFRRRIMDRLAAMGQPVTGPHGPDGWPEQAEAWITPQLLAARINWAVEAPAALVRHLPEPVALARRVLGPLAEGRLMWVVERAETRAEAVGLILASPQFNRR
jgi:uncharacterized protein (DUF1800 family)